MSRVGPGRAVLFEFVRDGELLTGMVVRGDDSGALRVWINRCPHVPYSLDLGDGNVIDDDQKTIVCSNHGARFEPATGRCIWGPVRGRWLEPMPFERVDATHIAVRIEPEADGWPETYEPG